MRALLRILIVAVLCLAVTTDAVSGFANGGDLVESARAAKLASGASANEYAAIRAIASASTEMGRRKDEFDGRRAERQRLTDDLRTERKNVEMALAFISKRDRALQSRLIPRAARGERAPQEETARPIPVVTDFICPLRGPMTFTDSWGAPRPGGRGHEARTS